MNDFEHRYEKDMERILSELTLEDKGGYTKVQYNNPKEPCYRQFDKGVCLDRDAFLDFIRESQPKQYRSLKARSSDHQDELIIDGFSKGVDRNGLINVIKNGFKVKELTFKVFYKSSEYGSDSELNDKYKANRFFCARQFHYSETEPRKSIDVVFLMNGIPVVAVELKNRQSGQDVSNAIEQYRTDRSSYDLMFRLNHRCLVAFAADNYEVWATTKLAGPDTEFFPFNQGSNGPGRSGGAGNPLVDGQMPTEYLFRDVLRKDVLQQLIRDYVHYDPGDGRPPRVIFPRFHQLHCVEYLARCVSENGIKNRFLIEHSAGSGKTNTITWLAYRLKFLSVGGRPAYDSVLICVHRLNLNKQLSDVVDAFEYEPGIVCTIKSGEDLRDAIVNGGKIFVTTIQKFSSIRDQLKDINRNFAVIFDEAHTSSTGKLSQKVKQVLGAKALTEEDRDIIEGYCDDDAEFEREYEKIRSEGMQDNMTFFAFTATPKPITLETFGKRRPDGGYEPHHVYSMKQAIAEKYICDVLEDYNTVKQYFQLVNNAPEKGEELVDTRKALRSLMDQTQKKTDIIAQKSRVIADYFNRVVKNDLGGRAKAMLVVDRREIAVRYKLELDRLAKDYGFIIHPMAAFTSSVEIDGRMFTESTINMGPDGTYVKESRTVENFDGDYFNLLIVASKFQVGFDQPKLTTMFVDKPLSGVDAVQTLSRLNRAIPGVDKHTHVLDFVNEAETIEEAFKPFYEDTEMNPGFDPYKTMDEKLNDVRSYGILNDSEVGRFVKEVDPDDPDFLRKVPPYMKGALDRYNGLDEMKQKEFRAKSRSLCKFYGSATVAYTFLNPRLRDVVTFLECLNRELPRMPGEPAPDLSHIDVKYYRLGKQQHHPISLSKGEPFSAGQGKASAYEADKSTINEIVKRVNIAFGCDDFTSEDLVPILNEVRDKTAEGITGLGDYASWPEENFKKQYRAQCKMVLCEVVDNNKMLLKAVGNDSKLLDEIADMILGDIKSSISERSEAKA